MGTWVSHKETLNHQQALLIRLHFQWCLSARFLAPSLPQLVALSVLARYCYRTCLIIVGLSRDSGECVKTLACKKGVISTDASAVLGLCMVEVRTSENKHGGHCSLSSTYPLCTLRDQRRAEPYALPLNTQLLIATNGKHALCTALLWPFCGNEKGRMKT